MDRYPTAAAFADDIRPGLAGFPTRAGNASVLERLAMWARRKPAAAFAAGMTVAFASHVDRSGRANSSRPVAPRRRPLEPKFGSSSRTSGRNNAS